MKILVVEDEERIALTVKKALEQERYVVDVAFNGRDGYDLASTEKYDAMILDLMLPGKDGLTICRELRQAGIQFPILILTARAQIGDKVVGLDTGADDYLTKPFSLDELFARIRALTRRPQKLEEDTLKVNDLSLDPAGFTVKRGDENIQLSQKEFSLLKYLMRNPHKIISKEQIMNQVWDYDADILPNTVEAYIKNLRKKIDAPFKGKPSLLKTIRGFGYRLGE